MFLADKLSRASIHGDEKSGPEFEAINMMKYLLISDERLKEIQRETKSDESLQVLTTVIRQGWPEQKEDLPNVVAPYFNIRDEMSIQDGLVFRGERVVIPQAMRSKMLGKVHNSHLGVNGFLNRARECLYWPGKFQGKQRAIGQVNRTLSLYSSFALQNLVRIGLYVKLD